MIHLLFVYVLMLIHLLLPLMQMVIMVVLLMLLLPLLRIAKIEPQQYDLLEARDHLAKAFYIDYCIT